MTSDGGLLGSASAVPPASSAVAAAGPAVAVGLLAYLIRRGEGGTRSASNRSRRLLLASRVLIVCLLVLGAMEPYTVQTRETPGEPGVTR